MSPAVKIFDFSIPSYGLMALVGAAAAILYIYLVNRGGRAGRLPGADILNLLGFALVGILVGGKLLGAITMAPGIIQNWSFYSKHLNMMLSDLFSTFVFYGGLLGMLLAVYIYGRRRKLSLRVFCGLMVPAIPLFHAFARVGCFLAGCCYGIEAPWGVVFNASAVAPNHVPLVPIQLFEAAFNMLLFAALAILSRRLVQKWRVLPIYFLAYGMARFVLEFFRGDYIRGHVWIFSTSQWISIFLIMAAVGLLIKYSDRRKQTANQ